MKYPMHRMAGAALGAVVMALAACSATSPPPRQAGMPEWIDQARGVATSVPPQLLAVLKAEIDKAGPAGAVTVCNEKAPQLARAASERSGWQVRRVSLRNRNPKAVPDAWEEATLRDFDRRAAAGEAPQALERAEEVTEGGRTVRRYMRALPVQELCLSCHGPADKIDPQVAEKLKALYPNDRAVGYRVGELRGAMTLRQTP